MNDRVYPCDYCKLLKSPCHEKNGGPGLVYCMSNPWYHDSAGNPLYKIGLSNDIIIRKKDLSAPAGVPTPFVLVFAKRVPCMYYFESKLHEEFQLDRINKSREFFRSNLDKIRRVFTIWVPSEFITSIEEEDKVPHLVKKKLTATSSEGHKDEHSIGDSNVFSSSMEYCSKHHLQFINERLTREGHYDKIIKIQKDPYEPEYVIFVDTLRMITDLKGKVTQFKTLTHFARSYYEKNTNKKSPGTSYLRCKFMDEEGNWQPCGSYFASK